MSRKIYNDTKERFKVYEQRHREERIAKKKIAKATLYGRLKDLEQKCRARVRNSPKNLEYDIDFDFLQKLWNIQNGKCAVTGLQMDLNSGTIYKKNSFIVSVDRKNSSLGYTKDNIQLVCFAVNQIKSDFTDEEFEFWIRTISSQAFSGQLKEGSTTREKSRTFK